MPEQQKELFPFESEKRQFPGLGKIFPRNSVEHKFAFTIHAERVVFIVIAVILAMVIVYALGVERGKASAYKPPAVYSKNQPVERTDTLKTVAATRSIPTVQQSSVLPRQDKQPLKKETAVTKPGTFTIVALTLSKRDTAVAELEYLKKEGYQAYLAVSGSYHVVCVGNFESREAARPVFNAIRARYKDAFIKMR